MGATGLRLAGLPGLCVRLREGYGCSNIMHLSFGRASPDATSTPPAPPSAQRQLPLGQPRPPAQAPPSCLRPPTLPATHFPLPQRQPFPLLLQVYTEQLFQAQVQAGMPAPALFLSPWAPSGGGDRARQQRHQQTKKETHAKDGRRLGRLGHLLGGPWRCLPGRRMRGQVGGGGGVQFASCFSAGLMSA